MPGRLDHPGVNLNPAPQPSRTLGTHKCVHARRPARRLDARTCESKFRAITRAITLGQPGGFTVTRGRSTQEQAVHRNDKTAGQKALTCGFRGGQGRGRTADLPIFRKKRVAVCQSNSRVLAVWSAPLRRTTSSGLRSTAEEWPRCCTLLLYR